MKKTPLSDVTIFLMIFTVLCLEGIQAFLGWIPIVGNFFAFMMDVFIFFTFFLWFLRHGIKMMTLKRFGSMGAAGIIEMIPYLNLLPAWTLVVIYLIGTTKIMELAEKNPSLAAGAMTMGKRIKGVKESTDKSEELPEGLTA